jgi:hypothetical protein
MLLGDEPNPRHSLTQGIHIQRSRDEFIMKIPVKMLFVVISGLASCLFLVSLSKGLAGQPIKTNNALALAALATVQPEHDPSNLKLVKPGRPEAKSIAKPRAQDKAASRPGHVNLDGMAVLLAQGPPPVPEYKGSHLQIDPRAEGDLRAIEERFAAMFLHQDPQPESRKSHFTWIPFSLALRQIGWYGAITDAQVLADQSVEITIKIQPWLFSNSRSSIIFDFVKEKYLVSDGRFTLLDGDVNDTSYHYHKFPHIR